MIADDLADRRLPGGFAGLELNGAQGLRREAQGIAQGQPDVPVAVVEAQDSHVDGPAGQRFLRR